MIRFHVVLAPNETLSQISQTYGVPMAVLRNINAVGNENRLPIGKKIYLREEDVLGVQVLLLDTDRNPIKDQKYSLEFSGRVNVGATNSGGLTQKIYTETPTDRVRVLIERLDGSLKEVATVDSGYRNKLVTILTPRYRADARTEFDHAIKPGEAPQASVVRSPIHDAGKHPAATAGKQELGPVAANASSSDKRPLTHVQGDIPELGLFLDEYDGARLSNEDINSAAEWLRCAPGMIHAIAKQESSKSSFFRIGSRTVPTILYERHLFRNFTAPSTKAPSPYEAKYPDICGNAYHRTKRENGKTVDRVTGTPPIAADVYGPDGVAQYRRLLKAYQLNPDAALRACSWGKFQILGNNHKEAGFKTAGEFVRAMSRNEGEHLKAFLHFAQHNRTLRNGLRQKDFEMVAEGHNGTGWRKTNPEYATNLRKFYEEYINDHPAG
jgi:hypothetical protein